eukprot:117136-Rhodomonas_salina.3
MPGSRGQRAEAAHRMEESIATTRSFLDSLFADESSYPAVPTHQLFHSNISLTTSMLLRYLRQQATDANASQTCGNQLLDQASHFLDVDVRDRLQLSLGRRGVQHLARAAAPAGDELGAVEVVERAAVERIVERSPAPPVGAVRVRAEADPRSPRSARTSAAVSAAARHLRPLPHTLARLPRRRATLRRGTGETAPHPGATVARRLAAGSRPSGPCCSRPRSG